MYNYDGKTFKPVSNSPNGETSGDTTFHYRQTGNILTADYNGGRIQAGHLIGLVGPDGVIDMRYHQVNESGELMTGRCRSVPARMDNGKIRLYETWEWTSGDRSSGQSIIEEQ